MAKAKTRKSKSKKKRIAKSASKKSAPKMKLFYSPIHGFIHKVLVAAHETGIWNRLEFVPVLPMSDGFSIAAINPLHKVPTLALHDGTVLYGSQTIVEFFDSLSKKKKLYPKAGPARWDALRRLALADTTFEVTVNVALELNEKPRRQSVFDWYWPKIVRALDQMEEDAKKLKGFDIGQASTLHALSYLDRQLGKSLPAPVPRGYDWRDGRPKLTAWWKKAIKRPSVKSHFKKDYVGDQSPEFAQQKIAEVLRAQGKRVSAPTRVDYAPG
ncbi:MAG: glutathione S-transferase [Rhodobacteraceae bacterium]|nr:glutathione S-transferase [Paracoccaceae bacterium]